MELEDFATRSASMRRCGVQAYEDAGVQGLYEEGRWKEAVTALKTVELMPLLREFKEASAAS